MVVNLCDALDRNCTFLTKKIKIMNLLCIKYDRGRGVSCGVLEQYSLRSFGINIFVAVLTTYIPLTITNYIRLTTTNSQQT